MRRINIAYNSNQPKMGWRLILLILFLRLIRPFRRGNSAAEIKLIKRQFALQHGIKEEEVMDYLAKEAEKRRRLRSSS